MGKGQKARLRGQLPASRKPGGLPRFPAPPVMPNGIQTSLEWPGTPEPTPPQPAKAGFACLLPAASAAGQASMVARVREGGLRVVAGCGFSRAARWLPPAALDPRVRGDDRAVRGFCLRSPVPCPLPL